ncbi:MAG: hypothetical protein ACJ75S_04870 [Solirubrobacterales bacterium]
MVLLLVVVEAARGTRLSRIDVAIVLALAAAGIYGSFAYSLPELMGQSEEVRHGTDVVAARMLHLDLVRAADPAKRGCRRLVPRSVGELLELPRGGAVLRAGGDTPIALRRFADRAVVPIGS